MASTVAFKPIDPKRDEFRSYLERAGVIEALTKVIIRIVKERPPDPLEYLRTNLGDSKQQADEFSFMQKDLENARLEIQRLRKIIENVNPAALLEENQIPTAETDGTANEATLNEQPAKEEVAPKVETEANAPATGEVEDEEIRANVSC